MSHTLAPHDLTLARRVAAQYGPEGDGELESAAMAGLLAAAATFDGRSAWRAYARQRVRWALLDHVQQRRDIPVDVELLPDTTEPMHTALEPTEDEETIELVHEVLAGFDALDMLDRVDRRRTAHRLAFDYLQAVLT